MKKGLLILAATLVTMLPVSAQAVVRVAHPRVFVGGGWYGPGWYNPYWGPYYPYGAYAYPNTGEVKIDTKVKDAQVFINGAYAGATHDNKTMHLRPGSYAIEIREGERTQFSQQIYVALGKTVHLHPAL